MAPKEIHITEELTSYVAKHGLGLLVHNRDAELMRSTIESIKDTDIPKILLGHHLSDDEKRRILYVLRDYLHLFELIIWNDLSRQGHRSDVRYHSFEKALELFEISIVFLDSDYTRACRYEARDGITKRWPLESDEIIEMLDYITAYGLENNLFATSVKHNDNNLHREEWNFTVPILSGVWALMLVHLREFRRFFPDFNPFFPATLNNMEVAEDLIASWTLRQMKRLGIYSAGSWDGDRGSYDNITFKKLRDWTIATGFSDPEYIRKAQQQRWNGGELNQLRVEIKNKGIVFKDGVAVPASVDRCIFAARKSSRYRKATEEALYAD